MAMKKLRGPWPPEVPLMPKDVVVIAEADSDVCPPSDQLYPGDLCRLTRRLPCGCWEASFDDVCLPDGRPAGNKKPDGHVIVGTGQDNRRCFGDGGTKIRKVPWQ